MYDALVQNAQSEVLEWLYRASTNNRHIDIRERRMDGLGAWIFEVEEFLRWSTGGEEAPSLLWVHGIG
jgi:hypothetical protein